MVALYILGNGSTCYNEELRFSLRTIEKYAKGIDRVIVAGELPELLSDKVFKIKIDEAKGCKEYRIAMKIYNAIKLGKIKGDFIFMNDDFFLTQETDFTNYPNYAKETLNETRNNSGYQISLRNTYQYLLNLGYTTYHFDVHTPIIYNAEKFVKLINHFEYSNTLEFGLVVKSLYGNIYGLEPTIYTDCKLWSLDLARINKTHCFSSSDAGWQNGLRSYLKSKHPSKSSYEK